MSRIIRTAVAAFSLALAAPGAPQSPSSVAPIAGPAPGQSLAAGRPRGSRASDRKAGVTAKLLGLTREWVGTWNDKDVDRMRRLHDDDFLYGIFGSFIDGQDLLKELRKDNFWGLTYSLKIVEPRVRILSSDTALVLFRLVGQSVGPKGSRPYASLFTLVYRKRGDDWKIVHVHDSESPESSS